ncbi:unnamed protein product [Protopolystoma xenopodis]|uniref:Uncharacterized protein n=1 Tax=Protopolystoma xenopodis TaxID=117903 RepID=A0A448X1G4_9PLAT|nr:unnamed protein product [Protopolystoma xenopodis]
MAEIQPGTGVRSPRSSSARSQAMSGASIAVWLGKLTSLQTTSGLVRETPGSAICSAGVAGASRLGLDSATKYKLEPGSEGKRCAGGDADHTEPRSADGQGPNAWWWRRQSRRSSFQQIPCHQRTVSLVDPPGFSGNRGPDDLASFELDSDTASASANSGCVSAHETVFPAFVAGNAAGREPEGTTKGRHGGLWSNTKQVETLQVAFVNKSEKDEYRLSGQS